MKNAAQLLALAESNDSAVRDFLGNVRAYLNDLRSLHRAATASGTDIPRDALGSLVVNMSDDLDTFTKAL